MWQRKELPSLSHGEFDVPVTEAPNRYATIAASNAIRTYRPFRAWRK